MEAEEGAVRFHVCNEGYLVRRLVTAHAANGHAHAANTNDSSEQPMFSVGHVFAYSFVLIQNNQRTYYSRNPAKERQNEDNSYGAATAVNHRQWRKDNC